MKFTNPISDFFKANKAKRIEKKQNHEKAIKKEHENKIMRESLSTQITEALEELKLARQDENFADEAYREVAIERVRVAQDNLSNLYKQAKLIF